MNIAIDSKADWSGIHVACDSRFPAQCSVSGNETYTEMPMWRRSDDMREARQNVVMTTTMTTFVEHCPCRMNYVQMEEWKNTRNDDFCGGSITSAIMGIVTREWIIIFILLWQNTTIHEWGSNWCRMIFERWQQIAMALIVSVPHRFRFLFTDHWVPFNGQFAIFESANRDAHIKRPGQHSASFLIYFLAVVAPPISENWHRFIYTELSVSVAWFRLFVVKWNDFLVQSTFCHELSLPAIRWKFDGLNQC